MTLPHIVKDAGKDNIAIIHPSAKVDPSIVISFNGDGHRLEVLQGAHLRAPLGIHFQGYGGVITIGEHCNIRGSLHVRQRSSRINIGSETTAVGAHLFALEGASIVIGDDCMFAAGIAIRSSDEHPIYDIDTNMRLNPAKSVHIGKHVWIGEGATISKGVHIADGCIIAAKALLTRNAPQENSIYGGAPATLIRTGVYWSRKLPSN